MSTNQTEIWRTVPGWEDYQVSNLGRIASLKYAKKRILSPVLSQTGRARICLSRNNQKFYFFVHRLVLEAFVGPCPEGMETCHGPNGRSDNSLGNLCWGTKRKNNMEDKERDGIVMRGQRHPRAKLTEDQVVEIRASPESCAKVAKLYGVSKTLIGNIRRRSTWTHI